MNYYNLSFLQISFFEARSHDRINMTRNWLENDQIFLQQRILLIEQGRKKYFLNRLNTIRITKNI